MPDERTYLLRNEIARLIGDDPKLVRAYEELQRAALENLPELIEDAELSLESLDARVDVVEDALTEGATTLQDEGVADGVFHTVNFVGVGVNSEIDPPGVAKVTIGSSATGTWTPGLAFGGATTGITYGAQVGRYTRIGNIVHAQGYVQLTNNGTAVGAATITGLPFTSKNAVNFAQAATFGLTHATTSPLIGWAPPNGTTITLWNDSIDGAATQAHIADTSEFVVSITYECEP